MDRVATGINFLGDVYGLHIRGGAKLSIALDRLNGTVREVKLEITRFDEPLIVYGFIPGVFSGYVPLIVPIRETQSEEVLDSQVSIIRESGAECPSGWRRQNAIEIEPFLSGCGFNIWASPILRSHGVISSWLPEKGYGFIQSGGKLLFLGSWVDRGVPEIGCEVDFLPAAELRKGLQARAVRALPF